MKALDLDNPEEVSLHLTRLTDRYVETFSDDSLAEDERRQRLAMLTGFIDDTFEHGAGYHA